MGGKISKPTFSRFDDLVADHKDVFARLKEVLVALGLRSPGSAKCKAKVPDDESCSSSDSVLIVVQCDEVQTPPAATAAAAARAEAFAEALGPAAAAAAAGGVTSLVPSKPQWCSSDSAPIQPVQLPLADQDTEANQAAPSTAAEVAPAAVAAAAEFKAVASKQGPPTVPLLQLSALVPPLNALMRISVSSAAKSARGEAESVFDCINQEQQQLDKAAALQELAAAAAAAAAAGSSSGGCRPLLSEAEQQALRASGKQARDAASRELAAAVDCSDNALQGMTQEGRVQWFKDHAQQQQDDAHEESFDDEWATLPPEVLAMAAELQSRG